MARRPVLITLAVLLLLALAYRWLLPLISLSGDGGNGAAEAARERAERIGRDMTLHRVREASTMDLMRRADIHPPGTTFLRAEGSPRDDDAVIVARISISIPRTGWNSGSSATRCFEYRIGEYGLEDGSPREVDCPDDAEPIAVTSPTPAPRIRDGAVGRLRERLTGLSARDAPPDADALRRAATDVIAEPRATVDVDASDGWLGVGVRAGSDCLLARVRDAPRDGDARDGDVEVWVPPRVTVLPGEQTCDGGTAAQGLAKRPPS